MDFDIKGAREAGYSDDEIADFWAPQLKFDAAAARKAGYGGKDIVDFLQARTAPQLPAGEVSGETRRLSARSEAVPLTVRAPDPAADAIAENAVRQEPGMRPAARRGGTTAELRSPMQNPRQDVRRIDNLAVANTPILDRAAPGYEPGPADLEQMSREPVAARASNLAAARARRPLAEAKPLSVAQEFAQDAREVSDNPLYRGGLAGFSQLGQTGIGAVRGVADAVGATGVADFAGGASRAAEQMGSAAGQGLSEGGKLASDITSSIINSAPSLALGLAGGPALKALFAQSALAEYNSGRNAGFSGAESAARAGIMGFAEALGERFGLSQQIQLLKGVAKNLPADEMSKVFGNMLAREIPGEQLTSALQFMADKVGPAALNPDATIDDYLKQAGDTLAVTIGQSAVMGGGPAAINTTRQALRRADLTTAGPEGAIAGAIDSAKPPPRPTELRSQHVSRIDDFAATFGVKPNVVAAIKKATETIPLEKLPQATKAIVQTLAERGLIKAPTDPQTLAMLDDPAISGLAEDVGAAQQGMQPEQPADALPGADLLDEQQGEQAPQPASPETVGGAPINRNWREFSPESGSLGIPREQMPQIPNRGALANFLNAKGIDHQIGMIPAEALKPTQAEFSPQKIKGYDSTRSVIVSSDGHILDGHHAWLSALEAGQPVNALQFNAPIQDLLRLAHQLPSSTTAKGPTRKGLQDAAAVAGNAGPELDQPGRVQRSGGVLQPAAPGADTGLVDGALDQRRELDPAGPGRGNDALSPASAKVSQMSPGRRIVARAGRTPNAASDIEARDNGDGTITPHMDGEPMLDYDSGEPLRIPDTADDMEIKKAIRAAGAVSNKTNFYAPRGAQPTAEAAPKGPSQAVLDQQARLDAAKKAEQVAAAPAEAQSQPVATGKKTSNARMVKHPKTVMGSRLLADLSAVGGLHPKLLSEFSEKKLTKRTGKDGKAITAWNNPLVPGIGRMFRDAGKADYEEIAEVLEGIGYLDPGTVAADPKAAGEQAKELVRAALNKQEPKTWQERQAEAEADNEANRQAWEQEQAELRAENLAEEKAEREAIMAENDLTREHMNALRGPDTIEAADPEWELLPGSDTPQSIAAGMREMGFTEQEIASELAERFPDTRSPAARGPAEAGQDEPARPGAADGVGAEAPRDQAANQEGGAQEGLSLEAQSEADLKAKADREKTGEDAAKAKRAAEQERLRKEAEQRDNKARADQTVDSFVLGQSADQQMSGMDDLFADPPAPAPAEQPAKVEPTAKQPDMAGFTGVTDVEMALRNLSRTEQRPGDVKLGNEKFVTLDQAVAAARQAMTPEQWGKPFQFSHMLDIAPVDWTRMVEAMKSQSAPAGNEADPTHKVGDMVKLTKPGLNGPVNISGTITQIKPDGQLEIRTQQDGYLMRMPSELGHRPGPAPKPKPPEKPAATERDVVDLRKRASVLKSLLKCVSG